MPSSRVAPLTSRTALVLAVTLCLAALGTVAALMTGVGGEHVTLAVADLGEMVFAAAAAISIGHLALRSHGRARWSWGALAAGCAAWAAGEGLWSWFELVLGRETPFPSIADLGFLLFPVGASLGLWLRPSAGTRERGRRLLDSLTVTTALALVSWATALGAVAQAGAASTLALLVSLAYPAGDLVVLALLVIVLSRSRADRGTLVLVSAGIASIALADSLFAYQTAVGDYAGSAADIGWVAGFALLALAPLAHRRTGTVAQSEGSRAAAPSALPYVPVLLAALVIAVAVLRGHRLDAVEVVLAVLTVSLVLLRQYSVVRQNSLLVGALQMREEQLQHQAFHDGLTGLANRALFHDRVVHALDLHRRDLRDLSVLFCDLDDFKLVNDTLGHQAGDELLVRVAERLRGALRAGDTLARLGGDEFAILLEDGGDPWAVAAHVIGVMQSPYSVGHNHLQVHASVGLALVDRSVMTPSADVLLAQADTAMYAAKRTGKGCFRAFEPGMELDEVVDDALRRRLSVALTERRLTLAYQPITDLNDRRLLGFEALARWEDEGVQVPPDVFVPVAERTGLIAELTELVLDLACGQIAAWDRAGARTDFTVAVNVPPQRIVDPAFPAQVLAHLARHQVAPERLVLEITESGLLTDLDAARQVTTRLNELGIRLSLDDFGVGYSSLTHLSTIPLQSIKMDRAFVGGLGVDEAQSRFASALLRFGANLGLEVIAEGVEGVQQLDRLRELGCAMGQGYLLGRPAAASSWDGRVIDAPLAGDVPALRTVRHPETTS